MQAAVKVDGAFSEMTGAGGCGVTAFTVKLTGIVCGVFVVPDALIVIDAE